MQAGRSGGEGGRGSVFTGTSDLVVGVVDLEHVPRRPCYPHGGEEQHALLLLVPHAVELSYEFLFPFSHRG